MCRSRSRRSRRSDPLREPRVGRRFRARPRSAAGRLLASGLAGALACGPASGTAAIGIGEREAVASAMEATLLAVRVNGVDQDDAVRALRIGPRLALNKADWAALHLREPAVPMRRVDGQDYRVLEMPGLSWHVDEATQTLLIDAPAAAFTGATLRMDTSPTTQAMEPAPGAYANYDVEVQRSLTATGANHSQSASALVDVGAFGFGGSFGTTALLLDNGAGLKAVRLDSTWTQDHPAQLASLRIGDAVSRAGAWGNALRFAGIQWATDFTLQPGLLTFPLPAMRGEAALPSTVDVFINNSRRMQGDVPPGPFDLTELPIVTGRGEIRLVVRDALGREQVITQPYYVSPSLLKPGLHAYSVEVGAVRDDYGLASDHYGGLIASATDRAGVTEQFTRELRAEAQSGHAAAGATGMWLIPALGLASVGAVGSVAHGQAGASAMASLERQGVDWNGSVQIRRNTAAYVQAGQAPGSALRTQASVALGGTIANMPVGLSYILQTPFSGAPTRLLSFNVSRSLGGLGTVGFFALHDAVSSATTLSLSLSLALDSRSSVGLSTTRGTAATDKTSNLLQYQRNLPDDSGFGVQVSAARGNSEQATGQLFGRTTWADANLGVSRGGGQTDVRAGVTGALAWMDDSMFATRRIDGSFAVVEVGDYADVAVLRDHHEVARTDEHGRAFVAGLRGYEVNRIGAEPADLPLDASVDALDIEFVPPARSGVVLRMPIKRSRSATFRVVGPDGLPLPAGTQLVLQGRDVAFPVGFDGRGFIAGLAGPTAVHAHGAAGDCRFVVAVPAGDADDLPDIGTLRCR